ncbi:MAG: hypothetical protein HY291_14495 [Planctomycetes bacterium]|nr:hypothetical protein [Planctomycetota bacterium]
MSDIFQKIRLNPTQLRTVADRRFDDAKFLCNSKLNARANAAMYLGGFVLECILKAKLMEKFAWLQSMGLPQRRSQDDQRLWSLCYRSHNLGEILERIPEVFDRIAQFEQQDRTQLAQSLKKLCARWTIYARYSTQMTGCTEATQFVDQIQEIRKCLR